MNHRRILEQLVRTPSPSGEEAQAVRQLQYEARAAGFTVCEDEVGNFIARTGRGQRTLLFVGHIDTVPGRIPVRIEDDVLWGRGSVDAKGPLVAALAAAHRQRDDPHLRIIVVGAVGEEADSRGVRALADYDPEWILIGEPSGTNGVTLGYRGILRCTFTVERDVAHAGHDAQSAADGAFAFWRRVREHFRFHNSFDNASGRIDHLETTSDGITECCSGRIQLRLPPHLTPQDAADQLRSIAGSRDVSIAVEESVAAARGSRRNPLVASLMASIRAQDRRPRPLNKTGTADFNHLAVRYPGVPIAAYGPGDSRLDHTPRERIDLHELDRAVDILTDVMRRLSKPEQAPGDLRDQRSIAAQGGPADWAVATA